MAPFSLQKLFWLCLTPAPSGSYPSSVLPSSTYDQQLFYPHLTTKCFLINWAQVILSVLTFWVGWFWCFLLCTLVNGSIFYWPCCLFISRPICDFFCLFFFFPRLSPRPCVPWSCSILPPRRKTLTWPCWPTFPWLCLTPLYAGGYPFVHLEPFPVWFPLCSSPPSHEPKLDQERFICNCLIHFPDNEQWKSAQRTSQQRDISAETACHESFILHWNL